MSAGGYEIELDDDGQCTLTLDGEVMWSSDGDEDFAGEFGEVDAEDMNDVAGWLVAEGYIPPGVDVHMVDESIEPGEESGWFETLDDDSDDEGDSA